MAVYTDSVNAAGVPNFAQPWMQLGKLEERDRWQGLAINIMENGFLSEFQDLRKGVGDSAFTRAQDFKQSILNRIDQCQAKIESLIGEYKKLLAAEAKQTSRSDSVREEKVTINALQFHHWPFYDHIIDDVATNSKTGCIDVDIQEEDVQENC